MKRVLTRSRKKEPDVVFEDLEWTRVKVELEDDDRKTAINAIEEVLEKVQEDNDKRHVLFLITYVVQQELFKSREIDVETVQKVASFTHGGETYSNGDKERPIIRAVCMRTADLLGYRLQITEDHEDSASKREGG
ncbi:hypothetical protein ACLB2K_048159 [Fragaria x ananassa]